jgi:hypothetical protein
MDSFLLSEEIKEKRGTKKVKSEERRVKNEQGRINRDYLQLV